MGKVAIVCIGALVGYAIYDSINEPIDGRLSSKSTTPYSSSNGGNKLASNESPGNCIFVWNDLQRTFVMVNDDIYDAQKYTNTIIVKLGKEAYAESLFVQLRKADVENNVTLAKSIAKEIRANALTVYFENNLTSDYINLLANQHNLRSRCL